MRYFACLCYGAADEPFLLLDPKYAPGYLEWTQSIFLRSGFRPVRTVMVDSAEVFFASIRAGVGVGLLSPLHLGGQCEGICFLKLTEPVADFPVSLVWNAQRANPLVDDFLKVVRRLAPRVDGASKPKNHQRSASTAMSEV